MNQKSLFDKGEIVEAYDGVPYVRGSDTSREAAESMEKAIGPIQRKILDWIKSQGDDGSTMEEAEFSLKIKHQTCSARFPELERLGLIKRKMESNPIGPWAVKRKNESGRMAQVYVVAK